jgi:VIT1/CCC1 family predicted Fe2+/Mn2+ transporter
VTRDDWRQAVFGATDGASATLGVIGALWFAGHRSSIALAVIGAAIAATVGMAGSEFVSDTRSSPRRALIMGGATLTGALTPGIPFFVGHTSVALIASGLLTIVLGAGISTIRARTTGWPRALLQVFGVFIVVGLLTTIAGLVAPGSGA